MKKTILVIDTGSSSMRGILFDLQGHILFVNQIKYTMIVGADGSAVMDAEVFGHCLRDICRKAAGEIREKGFDLQAVALDSQRSSVLAVDENVQPLAPILMWYDKRCADICTGFSRERLRVIYETCGMRLTPVSSAPKMLWLKRNCPEIYAAAYKLIGIHDYLLYTLTGRLVTDATCACRTALMDIRSFDWSEELLSIFEIERDKLCPILRPGSVVGELTDSFCAETGLSRVQVISAGGDQQCCLLGQGKLQEGTISVNSGSASYLSIPIASPAADSRMEVNISAYYGAHPWILEAANMGSGTLYQWFNRSFYHDGLDDKDTVRINEEAAAQPSGCDGLICFADFAGRGCPDTDPNARGIFWNVGLQHSRGAFARAILEGICFDIYACIAHMRDLGVPIHTIRSTGGLTKFPVFNQILADITGMEVRVSDCPEATATGAFYAALEALGYFGETLAAQPEQVYRPEPKAHGIYLGILRKREEIGKKRK